MKKILLVEDDPFVADIYRTKLAKEGFKVYVAKDGEMALKIMKNDAPDVVALDIILPKMDGWEVLRAIRSDPATKNVNVIVISNLGEDKHKKEIEEMSVMKYFVKIETSPEDITNFLKEHFKEN